jgi:hypothetical protein
MRVLKWVATSLCLAVVLMWAASARWIIVHTAPSGELGIAAGCAYSYWGQFMFTGWRLYPPSSKVKWWIDIQRGRDGTMLHVPLWIPCLMLAALSVALWWRDRPMPPGRCFICGYDLTGNVSGTCPECGCATKSLGKEECEVGQ